MAKDFIPTRDIKLLEWLTSTKTHINTTGAQYGMSPQEILDGVALCDEYIDQMRAADLARTASKVEVGKKKAMRKTHQPRLRKVLNKLKVTTLNAASARAMDMMSKKEEIDARGFKLKIKAKVNGDYIEVKFPKRGIQAAEFRMKISESVMKGEWINLGLRLKSPLRYKIEGYPQGTMLRLWFTGVGVVKDQHFGEWSDVTSVVYVVE